MRYRTHSPHWRPGRISRVAGHTATLTVQSQHAWTFRPGAALDAELCTEMSKLDGMGDARSATVAKQIAY
ncbi:hypothetical protein [Mycobacterium leprae]|uniref:hypothetical protein n=1 Tax=Mycobacterium leprae TaxID=1769 RepID=UPI001E41CC7F|nr:hypothetical protein [Mycobacterium leprae]